MLFPPAARPEMRRCKRCGHSARADRMVQGLGRDCAARLGLTGAPLDVTQDGPDLLEQLDLCEGWDR